MSTSSETQIDSVDYAYDAVGNRTDSGASIDTGNRLTAFDGYALDWDAGGYLTQKQGNGLDQTFHWSAAGRLDSVVTNGQTTRFAYDALGRRVKKSGPSGTTQYVHQGDHVALELDGQQNVTARYTYFPGVDRPHSVVRNGSVYYYARGPTNSVTGLFDASSSPVNRYRYSPWGEAELEVEGVENPYRYTGRRFDDETGLYHNRARYYDPELGRFISQDPLGLGAGINPYAYAGNDPVNATDPSGTICSPSLSAFLLRNFNIICPVSVGGLEATVSGGGGGTSANFPERGPREGAVTTVHNLASGIIGGGSSLNLSLNLDVGERAMLSCRIDILQTTGNLVLLLSGGKLLKDAGRSLIRLGSTALTNRGLKRKGLPYAGRMLSKNVADIRNVASTAGQKYAVGVGGKRVGNVAVGGAQGDSVVESLTDFVKGFVPGRSTLESAKQAFNSCNP